MKLNCNDLCAVFPIPHHKIRHDIVHVIDVRQKDLYDLFLTAQLRVLHPLIS